MVFFGRDTFSFYKNCLGISGVWPPDRKKRRSTIIFWITLVAKIAIIVSRVVDAFGKFPPFNPKQTNILVTFYLVISLIVQITLRIYGQNMNELIESTIDDWSSIVEPEERDIIKSHDQQFTYCFFGHIAYFIVDTVINFAKPLYCNLTDSVTERAYCGLPQDEYRRIIMIIMDLVNLIAHVHGYVMSTVGIMLFVTLSMHLVAQYRILKKRFESFLTVIGQNKIQKELRRLVDRHNGLLRASKNLEDSFSLFIGLNIFSSQLGLCGRAFELGASMKNLEFVKMINISAWMIFGLMVCFIVCHVGENLISSSQDIGRVFQQCEWYSLSKKQLKDYSIIVSTVHRPKTVTVAKFYELNFVNFLGILRAVYSYVTLIVSLAEK